MKNATIHALFVLALPLIVAAVGLSVWTALLLVIVALVWRWLLAFQKLRLTGGPDMVLEGIGISHYVEKVRWCLDRLGVDYVERICAGTLGAFYWGRTVPLLDIRTGAVRSSIGNSAEILRYLWGAYGVERADTARFLEPTAPRVALEQRLDHYGRQLQVWIYSHLLGHKDIMLEAWGANDPRVPPLQRIAVRILYPVQTRLIARAFRTTPEHYEKARGRIMDMLREVDAAVSETPTSILGDEAPNYTDFSFAALSSAWVLPANFANRKRPVLDVSQLPERMRSDLETFRDSAPNAYAFIIRLYEQERTNQGDSE